MRELQRSVFAVVVALSAVACAVSCKRDSADVATPDDEPKPKKKTKKDPETPDKPTSTPLKHRASHEACSDKDTPAPSTMTYGPKLPTPLGPACKTKADCKDKPNGRCAAGHCTYDGCYEDKDCTGSGTVCTCEQDGQRGYYCKAGNCAIDADCSETGYCSPTWSTECGAFLGVVGWYCHTKKDECVNDSECQKGKEQGYCAYDGEKKYWRCGYGHCVG